MCPCVCSSSLVSTRSSLLAMNQRAGCSLEPSDIKSWSDFPDVDPEVCFQEKRAPLVPVETNRLYVTPSAFHWPEVMRSLTSEECRSLAVVLLFCDFKRQKGQKGTILPKNE